MHNAKNRTMKLLTSANIDCGHQKLSNFACFNKISQKIIVSYLKCKISSWFWGRMPLNLNAKNIAEFDNFLAIFGDSQFELFRENLEESHNFAKFCQILPILNFGTKMTIWSVVKPSNERMNFSLIIWAGTVNMYAKEKCKRTLWWK